MQTPRMLLVAAALAAVANAANLASLTPTEKAALQQELTAWKASADGAAALANGFLNHALQATQGQTVEEAQLERLLDAKQRIAALEKANPEAKFGLTQFALMTSAEFKAHVTSGFNKSSAVLRGGSKRRTQGWWGDSSSGSGSSGPTPSPPTPSGGKDWTTSGCVAPVQDQGQCGSCWAFATVASVESAQCMASGNKNMVLYSEQQVTSCATSAGDGCNGGDEEKGLEWVKSNGGLCLLKDYAYTSGKSGSTGTCNTKCKKQALNIKSVVSVPQGQDNLVSALNGQPTTVAVTAGNDAWQLYKGGVITSCGDANAQLDHAVFAVGYDSQSFKIKNSWGTSWGEEGFIRIKRTSGNGVGLCQLATEPAYATM